MSTHKAHQLTLNTHSNQISQHNDKFVDYLQNQNLYNPEFDNQQSRIEKKSILKHINTENKGHRSLSTNNRVNRELNSMEYQQEIVPTLSTQANNQSQSSLDQNQQRRMKSFLSPDYYKYNFKSAQKKENQKDNALRDIETRRLQRDKALIENYFNIPLILRTNKKVLSELEQQSILNQSSITQTLNDDSKEVQQKQYQIFKQNQETYKLNHSLNKQLENHHTESKQEKQRFVLRDQLCGSPFKQQILKNSNNNNNNNTSLVMSSISTSAGSKQQHPTTTSAKQDRYSQINQIQANHLRSRSVKQYSYNNSSNKKKQELRLQGMNDSSNRSLHLANQSFQPQEDSFFLDSSIIEVDIISTTNNREKKIKFEEGRSSQVIHSSSRKTYEHNNNNISPFLNTSLMSIPKQQNQTEFQPLYSNSPQNTYQDQQIQSFQSCFTPIAESKKNHNINNNKNGLMMCNIIERHSPVKLMQQGIQKIEYIPSNDQPPLILPINEQQTQDVYKEMYIDEKGSIITHFEETDFDSHHKLNHDRTQIGQQQQSYFLKESFISNIAQSIKDASPTREEHLHNNNSNYLNNSQIVGDSFSILKESNLFLNKDSYQILKNFSVQTVMDKGTHAEIYKVKNMLTNKCQVAKRIPFISKYAEKAFQNEEFVLSYFFDESGQIKKQYQSHAGSFKLIQTTHIEKLQNEGLFIQQSGGKSLARSLLEIREETLKGELISHIYPTKLHKSLQNHKEQFYELIASVCEVIDLFSNNKIVHSDLRLENIFVETLDFGDSCAIQSLKVADFGSSFQLTNRKGVSNVIPEYMPPEMLQQMLGLQGHDVFLEEVPWSVDIWTLGCIMLEIIIGIPIWMPQRCLLHSHGCNPKKVTSGIFSHKNRRLERILEKQVKFTKQIEVFVQQYTNQASPKLFKMDQAIRTIILGIFKINPRERMSPQQILNILRRS